MNEFDNVVERRGTGSTKWSKYHDPDVLPFWVADMDFRAPAFIRRRRCRIVSTTASSVTAKHRRN